MNETEKITKKEKKERKKKNTFQHSTLNLWEQYDDFIRSLHLKQQSTVKKKVTFKQEFITYAKKVLLIFLGAFFTTAAFYFFIEPNLLYNSGLNGLLQIIARTIIGIKELNIIWFRFIYHGLSLLINSLVFLWLWKKDKGDPRIISTCIPYILSQFIWSFVFDKLNFAFNQFNPSSWGKSFSNGGNLTFAFPYYIVIAVIAAVIHSFGLSIIFKAQATPGGHDLVITHQSLRKKKTIFGIRLGVFSKVFNITIIALTILINGLYIEENKKIKWSIYKRVWDQNYKKKTGGKEFKDVMSLKLKNDIEKNEEKMYEIIKGINKKNNNLSSQEWQKKIQNMRLETNQTRRSLSAVEIVEHHAMLANHNLHNINENESVFIDNRVSVKKCLEEIRQLRNLLQLYISFFDYLMPNFLCSNKKYIQEDFYYYCLANSEEKKKILQDEINELEQIITKIIEQPNNVNSNKKKAKIEELENRKIELIKRQELLEQEDRRPIGHSISKMTNNVKMWATIVYVFISSYIMNFFFPHNKKVNLEIRCVDEENLKKCLKIIKEFSPIYSKGFLMREDEITEERRVFIIKLRMSKWDYQLYQLKLQNFGKIYEKD